MQVWTPDASDEGRGLGVNRQSGADGGVGIGHREALPI